MDDKILLNKLIQQYELATFRGDPSYKTAPLRDAILILTEKLHGGHRQTTQTLYRDTPRAPGPSAGRPLTLADYASRVLAGQVSFYAEPEPHPAPEEAGIRAGEIVAWRAWRTKNGLLTSTYKETPWEPGEVIEAHDDPVKEQYVYGKKGHKHIGIFAWKELGELTNYVGMLQVYRAPPWIGPRETEEVIGQVLLWGSVVEHEKGYRAQFAKVHTLMMGPDIEKLREIYGVPGI